MLQHLMSDAAGLPYQWLFDDAERSGTVLHREHIYGNGPPVNAVSGEILDLVFANTGERVLDIGCGAGPYVARLNGMGKRCMGVDIDTGAVNQARALGRRVFRMSATSLAFGDKTFDSAILVETLEHLPDYEAALAEATRVARSSVVVTVPDISVLAPMSKANVVPWHMLEGTHVNFFTPETLRQTLLRFSQSCEISRLGKFFEVDGVPMHMHAAAVARL
jgi:ubiquinone/menaquinone biosynthesis C-methylase UbiE